MTEPHSSQSDSPEAGLVDPDEMAYYRDQLVKVREINARLEAWLEAKDRVIAQASKECGHLEGRLKDAEDLLREVATSGVAQDDERLRYVEIQVDHGTWKALAPYRDGEI